MPSEGERIGGSRGAAVLVAAAFPPELEAIAPVLEERGGSLRAAAAAVGIGLPAAAVGAVLAVRSMAPRAVILVGTCGAYRSSGLGIGDVVVSRDVDLVDHACVGGIAELPDAVPRRLVSDASLSDALVGGAARAVAVATTLAVTVDDAAAARVAEKTGADVEHLEAFGVATACSAERVGFVAVLGVANFVGSEGRRQWRERHRDAARAAAMHVLRWLDAGADGLPRGRSDP